MKLGVYAGQTCFIVVPDFLLPPSATALYAPLIFSGFVDERAVRTTDISSILNSIDTCFYAIVEETIVRAGPLSITA